MKAKLKDLTLAVHHKLIVYSVRLLAAHNNESEVNKFCQLRCMQYRRERKSVKNWQGPAQLQATSTATVSVLYKSFTNMRYKTLQVWKETLVSCSGDYQRSKQTTKFKTFINSMYTERIGCSLLN